MDFENVKFKKKKNGTLKRRRTITKNESDEENDDEKRDNTSSANITTILNDLKEEQKHRKRQSGISAMSKFSKSESASNDKNEQDPETYGLQDPKSGDTHKKLLDLLNGQFTGQSETTTKDPHAELMNQYIEERLFGNKAQEEEKVDISPEDALYQIPQHLQVKTSNEHEQEGAPLSWNTGIAEVNLPLAYKIDNMKATEIAKSSLVSKKKGKIPMQISGNVSANFSKHRKEYAMKMKEEKSKDNNGMERRVIGRNEASDSQSMHLFRQHESRKRFR